MNQQFYSTFCAPCGALLVLFTLVLSGCGNDSKPVPPKTPTPQPKAVEKPIINAEISVPEFDAANALSMIQTQVDFGPRVPNTTAHKKCGDWIIQKLLAYGLDTVIQRATVEAYNGEKLHIRNIMGRYRPEAENRLMLFAHWDTRPYADRDSVRRNKPIDGANDGASGVAVWLEVARAIQAAEKKPAIGFDIIFFDAEDYGQPSETMMTGPQGNSWCLGTQHWCLNQPIPNYKPRYGILLDMVAGKDAVFPKEGLSMQYAPNVVNRVWDIGRGLGYTDLFEDNRTAGMLTDDHRYVNELLHIPAIDVIHYRSGLGDFGPCHHTHCDNMGWIDPEVMRKTGHTMLTVIYNEL